MENRYRLVYAHRSSSYYVRDVKKGKTVFRSDRKTTAITFAQKLNGFSVTDGDEQTYANQVRALEEQHE